MFKCSKHNKNRAEKPGFCYVLAAAVVAATAAGVVIVAAAAATDEEQDNDENDYPPPVVAAAAESGITHRCRPPYYMIESGETSLARFSIIYYSSAAKV